MVINLNSVKITKVNDLKGSVYISGSKNAAIPILCTSLITRDTVKLKNVPRISDIDKLIKIIRYLGCKTRWVGNTLYIHSKNIRYKPLIIEECAEIRGSYYLIPVLLFLFEKCEFLLPGGCKIGERPIDAHIASFEALGYRVIQKNERLWLEKEKEVKEFHYKMSKPSVGASINTILAALRCRYAVIDDLVLEPEGLAVIDFLNSLGFKILSLNRRVVMKGYEAVQKRYVYRIIPDRMEAMTFIVMGLLCGDIKVKKIEINHIKYPLDLLVKANYDITIRKGWVRARKSRGNSFDIKTDVYPLFPTDMQPLFGVLLAYSRGSCVVEETIFEKRMQIYHDLSEAGASINVIDNKAYIIGGEGLRGGNFFCTDLRQSAGLMLLALKNGGVVQNIQLLKRGYEDFFYKIKVLGAKFSIK